MASSHPPPTIRSPSPPHSAVSAPQSHNQNESNSPLPSHAPAPAILQPPPPANKPAAHQSRYKPPPPLQNAAPPPRSARQSWPTILSRPENSATCGNENLFPAARTSKAGKQYPSQRK